MSGFREDLTQAVAREGTLDQWIGEQWIGKEAREVRAKGPACPASLQESPRELRLLVSTPLCGPLSN